MNFIGRGRELTVLNKAYKSAKSEFIPIYGRRRIGKSELILQFIKDKPSIYFVGSKSSAILQIRDFIDTVAKKFNKDFLTSLSLSDWKKVLEVVLSQIDSSRKLILVLDEFQWTAKVSPELPSIIQQLWDLQWSKNGKIFLILCGSFVGFMEKEVLGKASPLFGRRTAQIFLKPFSYKEAGKFHPEYSIEEKAKTYFICGGIPLYLKFFDRQCSVEMNICNNFLDEYSVLHREAEFLLREELREVEVYYSILLSIAQSFNKISQIAANINIDPRNLPYYLNQLIELQYISKQYPLTGEKPTKKQVRYKLEDPFLRFWFKFIYPHISYILQTKQKDSFLQIIKPELPSYFGSCFEKLCQEFLPMQYEKEGINTEFQIGEYWSKDCQIDLVCIRKDGCIDICECKWTGSVSVKNILQELNKKINYYPNKLNATIFQRIFTRKPIKNIPPDLAIKQHTLNDMYCE